MESMHAVGIDVGKDELVVAIRDNNGISTSPTPFPNSTLGLKGLLVHLTKAAITSVDPILVESTGPYHLLTAQTLKARGFNLKVVNPLHSKQIARHSVRKRKTDKVDSINLAFLASQQYGYVYRETEAERQQKARIRHYYKLKVYSTKLKQHETYLTQFCKLNFHHADLLQRGATALETEILNTASSGNQLRYLDSIPGISPFLGAVILAELGDINRFAHLDQIVAFAGLDPQVKQSGGKPGMHGKLSKRGSATLRTALFHAAMGAAQSKVFKPLYQNYRTRGLAHTEALIVLSRKLLKVSVSLLKHKQMFDPDLVPHSTEERS